MISANARQFRVSEQQLWLILALLVLSLLLTTGNSVNHSIVVPEGLTSAEWSHLQSLITEAEYEFAWHNATDQHPQGYYWAPNQSQRWQTIFTPQGVQVTPQDNADWIWGLTLTSYGYTDNIASFTGHTPTLQADENTLTYHWNENLSEWWINTNNGLEQGFTLLERPANSNQSALVLEMAIEGNLTPHLAGDTIRFSDSSGTIILTYDKLLVTDASGKVIPAHFELTSHLALETSHLLQIHVNDLNATYPLTIDPWVQAAKLTASDATTGDNFGRSIAIDGDTVVVGSFADDDAGNGSGSAYVFVQPGTGWANTVETAKLTASDASANDLFGHSVGVSDDTIIIGAYGDDDTGSNSGSVYVFVRPSMGWVNTNETAKLTASDAATSDFFGISLDINDNIIVVGASFDDDGANGAGSAYVFVRPGTGWVTATETAKLTASDAAASDEFGGAVAIDGDTIVVGAYGDDDGSTNSGSAYVFVQAGSSWATTTETAKLTASDAAAFDRFGVSVGVNADVVVVGAYLDNNGSIESGSAYVFVRPESDWVTTTETAKLTASDAATTDEFGFSVGVSGNIIVVGAYGDDDGGSESGSAYVFIRPGTGWATGTETMKLTANDAAVADNFGISVAVDGDTVVIGARNDDDGGSSSGSAYIFEDTGPTSVSLESISVTTFYVHFLYGGSLLLLIALTLFSFQSRRR